MKGRMGRCETKVFGVWPAADRDQEREQRVEGPNRVAHRPHVAGVPEEGERGGDVDPCERERERESVRVRARQERRRTYARR